MAAKAVAAAAPFEKIIVSVRVAVQDLVVAATGNEDPGRIVVVNVELFQDVIVTLDAHSPRIHALHVLMDTSHRQPSQVDEAAMHIQTGDSVRRRQVVEIEDWTLPGEREIIDGLGSSAALAERDADCP